MAGTRKYMGIVEWTMKQIEAGTFQPETRFLSESALGDKFECSRQTVRRALEVLEQRGRITRIQGSGTFIAPNRSWSETRSRGTGTTSMTVGFVSTYMDNHIFPNITRGIERVVTSGGFALQMVSTHNLVAGETRALQFILERPPDAIIVEPTRSALPCANIDLYHSITRLGIPLVFIDSFYPELSVPYVALDDVKAGYIATRYLLGMGHRNIAGVFPHSHRQGHLRYLGYVKAHAEQSLPIQDELICWYSRDQLPEILHGNQVYDQLSRSSAALCYNDHDALLVIDSLRRKGRRVPEDLSVMGIDDSELAKISSLTSVLHPAEEMGETAAKMLLSMLNGSQGRNVLLQPELVERSSVRKYDVRNL